jgi:hypothetical protein
MIGALGLLAALWSAAEGGQRLDELLASSLEGRRRRLEIGVVHGLVQLLSFGLALILAVALVTVPSGLIGSLGFFPLLRGLGALTSASFVALPLDPPRREGDGALRVGDIARWSLRGAVDRVALFLPVLALATGTELVALALGVVVLTSVGAVWATLRRGRDVEADEDRRDRRGWIDRVRPWLQLTLGIAVVLVSGTFNWVLQSRDASDGTLID